MHLVRGHWYELDVAIDVLGLGNHPVLVGDPVAVLLHIILHAVVLCVEYVATISEQRGMLKNCKTQIVSQESLDLCSLMDFAWKPTVETFHRFIVLILCYDVLTEMFLQRCSYNDVLSKMFLQWRSYKDALMKMFLRRCSYNDVFTKMLVWKCSYENVLTKMFLQRCSYAVLINIVVAVSSNMRPLVDHQALTTFQIRETRHNW